MFSVLIYRVQCICRNQKYRQEKKQAFDSKCGIHVGIKLDYVGIQFSYIIKIVHSCFENLLIHYSDR